MTAATADIARETSLRGQINHARGSVKRPPLEQENRGGEETEEL
ncbi:hypothetical protein [Actinobaculum sp. 313]|nr:hypothetical protein [Actinobaculum sp. 313]